MILALRVFTTPMEAEYVRLIRTLYSKMPKECTERGLDRVCPILVV